MQILYKLPLLSGLVDICGMLFCNFCLIEEIFALKLVFNRRKGIRELFRGFY